MNTHKLAWRNLLSNPLNTALSLLLMTFGVGIISLLLLLNNQVENQLQNNIRGIDMVVGAKGSPLQLILSSLYHVDAPTGNISYSLAKKITKNPLVDFGIPLSYGDSYNGFRIVGTTHQYPKIYDATIKEGRLWSAPLEVVLGSSVATINQLDIGDDFYGTHGLIEGGHIHDNYAYKVVGILNKTHSTIDQLILTNTQSVWQVHNHNENKNHKGKKNNQTNNKKENTPEGPKITSMLVKFKSPIGLIQIPRKVNETTNLQAALPALEISRLTNLLGFGLQSINTIAFIIIIVSGISIFISLYNSLKQRRYELALMRVQGATKKQLVKLVLQEGITLSLLGTIFGLIISRKAILIMSFYVDHKNTLDNLQLNLTKEELWLFPVAALIGLLAALIPIIFVYNINIPKTLSNA